jgi:CheY-like chemotaxis protein
MHPTEADGAPTTGPNADCELPRPGLRVMCVDDNADAADSLGTLLEMVGCAVAVTHDAVSALARVDEFRPQICVLDITMPGMDGCELARRLRELPDGDRFLLIALTALGGYHSLERMADAGFDLYFAKPVPLNELYSAFNDFAKRNEPTRPEATS